MGQGFECQTVTVCWIWSSNDNSGASTFSFKLLNHYCRTHYNETGAPWINFCPERHFYLNICHLLWDLNHLSHSLIWQQLAVISTARLGFEI